MKPDLSVEMFGVTFKNPVMGASGTVGYGVEIAEHVDLATPTVLSTAFIGITAAPPKPRLRAHAPSAVGGGHSLRSDQARPTSSAGTTPPRPRPSGYGLQGRLLASDGATPRHRCTSD